MGHDAEITERETPAQLEPTKDGQAYAGVPALVPGITQFQVIAIFHDGTISHTYFSTRVGPPIVQPTEFHADWSAYSNRLKAVGMKSGDRRLLMPGATFGSAPAAHIMFQRDVSFAVAGSAGDPVISVDEKGFVTALRPGQGIVEARLGWFVARLGVDVRDPNEVVCDTPVPPQHDKSGNLTVTASVCYQ